MTSLRLNLPRFLLACGVGLSVQFMVSSLETLIFGDVIQTASADGEKNVARACEAAKRRALEIAPELLSLADWPLDDHLPAECVGGPDGPVAVIDDALPEAIEIADVPPVVSVVAAVSGDDVPVVKKSSSQSSLADQNRHPLGQQLAALDTQSLDDVRGGFDMNGISFTIGIERAVYINGNLIATNVLNVKELQSTVRRQHGECVAGKLCNDGGWCSERNCEQGGAAGQPELTAGFFRVAWGHSKWAWQLRGVSGQPESGMQRSFRTA